MIFISAGHYPQKPGAGYDGFFEHDEAVKWAEHIAIHIQDSCIVPFGILATKIAFINNRKEEHDLAIEIHFNSAVNSKGEHIGRGCETLYYPNSVKGKILATTVNAAMAEIMLPDRGIKEGWYKMNKENGPDFFLARTHCPAIIIEPDFIHRKELIQDSIRQCCELIAAALLTAQSIIYKGESK